MMFGNPFPFLKISLARFSNVSKENGIVIENHHLLGALATRQQIIDREEEDKVSPDLIHNGIKVDFSSFMKNTRRIGDHIDLQYQKILQLKP